MAPVEEQTSTRPGPARSAVRRLASSPLLLRLLVTIGFLALWFWTQSLIGARPAPIAGIHDKLHDLTAGLNAYFARTPAAANALLIVSSLFIDALGLFLLALWLFGRSVRPFLGLVILMLLRQLVQAFVLLPPPQHMIWHYPGFPSVLVTYGVANDFFFSGHTAIAVFGAAELARFKRPLLTCAAVLVILFEIATVLVLRAHYVMDVFSGVLAALCVAHLADRLAPTLDRLAARR